MFVCYDARDTYPSGFRTHFLFWVGDMDKLSIIDRVRAIAGKVAGAAGLELVNVDITGTKRALVLRVFIDKEGGVTIEDCSNTSRQIEDVLDADDFIPSRYVLEVSSPGIERELYSMADFVRFTGQLAKVKLKAAIDEQKTFIGPIVSVEDEKITIEDRTKGVVSFDYADVDNANLRIDLAKEFKGR
ncbi:ribosome maturation factor RimP [soil metagenome]